MILIYYYSKGKWWHIKVREKKGNILDPHMNIYHLMHLTIRTVDKSYYKKDLGNARSWNK